MAPRGPHARSWAGNEERWPGLQPGLMSDSEDPNQGRGERREQSWETLCSRTTRI